MNLSLSIYGEYHPNISVIYENLAYVYNSIGDQSRNLEYLEKAFDISKEILGEDHFDTLQLKENIAAVKQEMGQ